MQVYDPSSFSRPNLVVVLGNRETAGAIDRMNPVPTILLNKGNSVVNVLKHFANYTLAHFSPNSHFIMLLIHKHKTKRLHCSLFLVG